MFILCQTFIPQQAVRGLTMANLLVPLSLAHSSLLFHLKRDRPTQQVRSIHGCQELGTLRQGHQIPTSQVTLLSWRRPDKCRVTVVDLVRTSVPQTGHQEVPTPADSTIHLTQ